MAFNRSEACQQFSQSPVPHFYRFLGFNQAPWTSCSFRQNDTQGNLWLLGPDAVDIAQYQQRKQFEEKHL